MDLYFSPLACSMATRVALYEAGQPANYLEVDPKTKQVRNDGTDFNKVNPLGLVPTLRTDDGVVLTENAAILQYVADQFPRAGLGTASNAERSKLHQCNRSILRTCSVEWEDGMKVSTMNEVDTNDDDAQRSYSA